MARDSFSAMDEKSFLQFSSNQAYLALGVAIAAAADARIGSCPMSGFVPEKVHEILSLPQWEKPVAFLALGSEKDEIDGTNSKIRFDLSEIVRHYN
jgi:nitroreductase